jgi:predicted nucleic acid-binding Zn ribbon protein
LRTFNAATRAVDAAVDWAARLAFREERLEDDVADWVATSEFTEARVFAAEVD